MEENNNFDVVIIGGSYAGLSAAMALGRAIRNVLIIDNGKPCNRQTPHSHNFLTQDGNTPEGIAMVAREQVLAYPTVKLLADQVETVQVQNRHFVVQTVSDKQMQAKKLLFATGLKDEMPDIVGFEACWGISVIHCPYCHGYEYKDEPTGLLINGDAALEKAKLIDNWTKQLSIFTNGPSVIPSDHKKQLSALGINIIETPLAEIVHKEGYLHDVILKGGDAVPVKALYASVPIEQHCKIPQQLGCILNETGHIEVDRFQKTTVPGIYAAGDNASPFRSVAMAVSSGAVGGAMINHELISEEEIGF